jgi:hypothetical protein
MNVPVAVPQPAVIALTMQLGIFPAGMLALYPVLLLPGEIERLRGRRARRRS